MLENFPKIVRTRMQLEGSSIENAQSTFPNDGEFLCIYYKQLRYEHFPGQCTSYVIPR